MLNNLIEKFRDSIDIKDFFSYFNFEIVKEEILSSKNNLIFLLGKPGSGKTFMINYLLNKFPEKYQNFSNYDEIDKNKTLLIDEAQLLSNEEIEKLRVLSDRGIQILFAMHEKEGENIIKKPQFHSRYYEKIYMKPLNYEEFEKYVMKKFQESNYPEIITKKILKKIYKYSKGNFRLSKKIIFTSLNLLDFSLRNNLEYKKIDNCILTMALIELELK